MLEKLSAIVPCVLSYVRVNISSLETVLENTPKKLFSRKELSVALWMQPILWTRSPGHLNELDRQHRAKGSNARTSELDRSRKDPRRSFHPSLYLWSGPFLKHSRKTYFIFKYPQKGVLRVSNLIFLVKFFLTSDCTHDCYNSSTFL